MAIVEIISERCTRCHTCVDVCPMDVLRASEDGLPYIAYGEDCQSCYLCRHYCFAEAIMVTPDRARPSALPF